MTAMLNLLTSVRCLNSLYTGRPFLKIMQSCYGITSTISQDTSLDGWRGGGGGRWSSPDVFYCCNHSVAHIWNVRGFGIK